METQETSQPVFVARLVLGLCQGLALYLLFSAYDLKAWPATEPLLFAPLTVVALLVPLLISQALGNMRLRTLSVWAVVATAILAGLAWYDVWHLGEQHAGLFPAGIVPTAHTFFICGLFLFVAHALVACGDADRRIVAHYPTLFDLAWKLGVQAAIIVCFTATFWIMLWLGIALFDMIKLPGFGRLVAHPWVWIPLTTVAAGAAIHITDTRDTLVRGVRTLALTLLGWLLPVIALIAFAFLIALVFTGLQPLWETRSAAFLLMAASAVLIIHINAAYQDGDEERRPPHILRVAGTLASVLLVFIVWIAAYALWLRVDQYGWTVDRIYSASCVLVAAMFAVGYFVAALLPGLWLKLIERWNVYGTFMFLIVLLALSTPLADPMRLAVDSQLARLESGVVKPDKFDFRYLRNFGGRFGKEALTALSKAENEQVRKAALVALLENEDFRNSLAKNSTPKSVPAAIKIRAGGKPLPGSFLHQDWSPTGPAGPILMSSCGAEATTSCEALVTDVDGDGADEVIVVSVQSSGWWSATIFKENKNRWLAVGDIYPSSCQSQKQALLAGTFKTVTPTLPDLQTGPDRLHIYPNGEQQTCNGVNSPPDGGP